MKDLALKWDASTGVADLALENGDFALDKNGTKTAVLASLFTDATSDATSDAGSPRGWWGGAVGSGLWRHARGKNTQSNALAIKASTEHALAWLLKEGVIEEVEVSAERGAERVALQVRINARKTVFKGGLDAI